MSELSSGKHGDYKERKILKGNIVELLARGEGLEVVKIELEPGKTLGKAHVHKGEEFKYVLDGTIEFKIGDSKKILGAGGWLHHECSVPHSVANRTSRKASYITISAPPGCMAMAVKD